MMARSTRQQPATVLPRKTALRADSVESARAWADSNQEPVDATIWDTATPGFGLRVRRRDRGMPVRLTWVARGRARGKRDASRYALGEFPGMNIAAARAESMRVLSALRAGQTPGAVRALERARAADVRSAHASVWGRVMLAYATPPADVSAEDVAVWRRRYKDRILAAHWVTTDPALASLAHTSLQQLDEVVVRVAFDPLLKYAPVTVIPGASDVPPRRRGPGASLSSVIKLARYCRAAWNESTLARPATNPFAAWYHHAGLPPVPPRQGALTMTGSTAAAGASRRWLEALLAARDDAAMRTAADHLLLCLLWGSRARETALLTWADILFTDEHQPHVVFRASTTKTGRAALRPLLPWARGILEARRALAQADHAARPQDPVLWSPVPGLRHQPFFPPGRRLLTALDEAAWPDPAQRRTGKRITAHDLRRTVATGIYRQHLDLETVGMALGHAAHGSSVTANYIATVARLQAFASIYAAWERQLRRYLELPPLESDSSAPTQPVPSQLVDGLVAIAAAQGLTAADLVAALNQRA